MTSSIFKRVESFLLDIEKLRGGIDTADAELENQVFHKVSRIDGSVNAHYASYRQEAVDGGIDWVIERAVHEVAEARLLDFDTLYNRSSEEINNIVDRYREVTKDRITPREMARKLFQVLYAAELESGIMFSNIMQMYREDLPEHLKIKTNSRYTSNRL